MEETLVYYDVIANELILFPSEWTIIGNLGVVYREEIPRKDFTHYKFIGVL